MLKILALELQFKNKKVSLNDFQKKTMKYQTTLADWDWAYQ